MTASFTMDYLPANSFQARNGEAPMKQKIHTIGFCMDEKKC